MRKNKTAVGYIRVSTEEQAREGFSLENQKIEIQKKCKNNEWELLDVYQDEGISGALLDERSGLKMMFKTIKNKQVDYLVIYKLSRLSRKITDVVNIAELLQESGTYLISTEDNINTAEPMGKYFLYMAGIFAEMERDNIIVQVKGGMSQKAREGQWNGGTAPLGYDLEDKKLIVNDEEAEIVKLIFSEYLNNRGYKAIASMLNDKGYKTKRDAMFSGNSVKDILKNITYCGKIRWGYRKDWGKMYEGKRKRIYNEEPIIADGIHKAIISEETFNKVQELIKNNPRHHVKRFNGNHILSGLLRCPDCGYGMSIHAVKRGEKIYEYYTCNQYMNKKTCCKSNSINKNSIEFEFLNIFERILNEPKFKNNILSSLDNSNEQIRDLENSIKIKEKNIKQLSETEDKLFKELLKGDELYQDRVREKIQEIVHDKKELHGDIEKTITDIKSIKGRSLNLEEISELFENVGKVIKLLDREAQQSLIRKLVKEIKVEEKHITEVHFNFQQSFRIEGGKENRIISNGKPSEHDHQKKVVQELSGKVLE